jgi:phosphohistidine phosphatase
MKTLLLLRHGKSSWDDASLADIDRPLAPRGIAAASRMGREIARRGWLPDRALVSSSARTRATWELACTELGPEPETSFSPTLYEAAAEALLAEIRQTPDRIGTLILVGHNPGMADLVLSLADAGSAPAAIDSASSKFPTAALARLSFDGAWEALGPRTARLTHVLRPKDLGDEK